MNRRKATLALALLALPLMGGCARQRASANEWGCSFGDGPFEQSRKLKNALAPGESAGYSNDNLVTGPADVRFFFIDNDAATADFGSRPIEVPARGSSTEGVGFVDVRAEVQVRFVINENFCDLYIDNLKRIDDRTDLNYNAAQDESSGWAEFLNNSMNQKLIEATRPVLRTQDYITLSVNGPIGDNGELAYDVLADELSANLSRELDADLGGQFFCGPAYSFDGTIDGKLEGSGCPPLEVTVKSIKPVDPELLANLNVIVKNEEQLRKIESETALNLENVRAEQERAIAATRAAQQKAVAQAESDQETKVAQAAANQAIQVAEAEANQAIQLAQEQQRRQVEEAKAATDLAVAQARAEVAQQEAQNRIATEQARAAFCVALAAVNIRCDLLASAEAGGNIVPNINLSGTADGTSAATVVLDARP